MPFRRIPKRDQALEDYKKFEEAYYLDMPPYNFTVWDRYLFSRCSDEVPVLGLLRLFFYPMTFPEHIAIGSSEIIGQWCMQGTFTDEVKKIIEKIRDDHFDRDQVEQDLAYIEEHQAIFKKGPMQLSAVGEKEQNQWFDQAKTCILSKDPNAPTPIQIHPPTWYTTQEAYFAFSVLAWEIRPDPRWGLEDPRLDVWYKLGFGVNTHEQAADFLFTYYGNRYSFDSAEFKRFLYAWTSKTLGSYLPLEHCDLNEYGNFFQQLFSPERLTVTRLYQALCLTDDTYSSLVRTGRWGPLEDARKFYRLDGLPEETTDSKEVTALTRKYVLCHVLRKISCPLDLHQAVKNGRLRDFILKTHEPHEMEISEVMLDMACCNY